jgi:hypothetical protein
MVKIRRVEYQFEEALVMLMAGLMEAKTETPFVSEIDSHQLISLKWICDFSSHALQFVETDGIPVGAIVVNLLHSWES